MLSAMTMILGAIIASTSWVQVVQIKKHPLQPLDAVVLYLHSLLWTLLCLVSAFGLFAAIRASYRLLTIYWILLVNLALSAFVNGIAVFVVVFSPNKRGVVNKCLAGYRDNFTLQGCRNGLAMLSAVAVVIYVFVWLFLPCMSILVPLLCSSLLCFSVSAVITWGYAYQVKRGLDVDPNAPVKSEQISNPAPLTMYNSFGAPGHNTGYAFSSVDNAFGRGNANTSILGNGVGASGGGHSRNLSGARADAIV